MKTSRNVSLGVPLSQGFFYRVIPIRHFATTGKVGTPELTEKKLDYYLIYAPKLFKSWKAPNTPSIFLNLDQSCLKYVPCDKTKQVNLLKRKRHTRRPHDWNNTYNKSGGHISTINWYKKVGQDAVISPLIFLKASWKVQRKKTLETKKIQ